MEGSPYGFAFVLSAAGTLLGRLRKSALLGDPDRPVEDAMEPGPSTVRADTSLESLRRRVDERSLKTAVVTTPEGTLIGAVRQSDLPQ